MNLLHQQNIKLIIFDFDGTIADTSSGIIDSHKYTLLKMGKELPNDDSLRNLIGGNLLQIYQNFFGLDKNTAIEAIRIYRNRYSEKGIHLAVLYPKFKEMLEILKKNGFLIGVATLKSEKFAILMLKELGIYHFFDVVCGMNDSDSLSKKDLILRCCSIEKVSTNEALLVGDSMNDYLGSIEAGTNFVGVKYGFGFDSNTDYDFNTIEFPLDLIKVL